MSQTTTPSSTDIKRTVQESHDRIASTYTEWVESGEALSHGKAKERDESKLSPRRRYTTTLLSRLPPGSRVLELGCGAGTPVTQWLLDTQLLGFPPGKVEKVVANNISGVQLGLARKNCMLHLDRVDFKEGDMMSLQFSGQVFEGVVAFFSIFYLPKIEQKLMLEKVYEWLIPGGILICTFGTSEPATNDTIVEGKDNGGGEAKKDEEKMEHWDVFGAEMFWSGWGVQGTINMLKSVGFEILETEVAAQDVDEKDPDYGVEFLWVVARKQGGSQNDE